MTRPNFLLIGAPKAGSTTLWHHLRDHPEVFMPEVKEPNFFCDDAPRAGDRSWYRALFAGAEGKRAVGEASVAYSLVERNPGTPARIARELPGVRLLYIVRHPLKRIESAWRHHLRSGNPVPGSFSEAVHTFRPILEGTLYARNLNAFRKHFSDRQIQVVFLEELQARPADVLRCCDEFLRVDPALRPRSEPVAHNASAPLRRDRSALLSTLRRLGAESGASDWLPAAARAKLRAWTTAPLPEPVWDPGTRRWALEQLREDAAWILSYAGKPADYWDLAADAAARP